MIVKLGLYDIKRRYYHLHSSMQVDAGPVLDCPSTRLSRVGLYLAVQFDNAPSGNGVFVLHWYGND